MHIYILKQHYNNVLWRPQIPRPHSAHRNKGRSKFKFKWKWKFHFTKFHTTEGCLVSKASKLLVGMILTFSSSILQPKKPVCLNLSCLIVHPLWKVVLQLRIWINISELQSIHSENTAVDTETKSEWGHIVTVGMERDRSGPLDILVLFHQ